MALRPSRTPEHGFTLVELLFVILIIGILAAIAIPMFLNQRKAAVDASVKSDIRNALTLTEHYKKELFANMPGLNQSIYFLSTANGTKAYKSVSGYEGGNYPVGDEEFELPEGMKGLKVSEGTVLSISGTKTCYYAIQAANQGGDEAHSEDPNELFAGGYVYLAEVGEIHPERTFWDPGGPYEVAMSKPGSSEFYDSLSC